MTLRSAAGAGFRREGSGRRSGGEIFVRVSVRRRLGAGEGDLTGARAPASCPSSPPRRY